MNSTPEAATPLDPADPLLRQLADAVSLAHAAAQEDAGDGEVGAHVGFSLEDAAAVTHLFDANTPGYRGWRWAVTVASAGVDCDVTVSEVVLLPGPEALVAPEWVPWQQRVQAGDLGVGDLMPTAPDDPRLVPGYVESDDPAVESTAKDVGLGRVRVMSRGARLDAAARWQSGEFGPRSDMARGAPGPCGTCGFYLPLAGSLAAAFGVCGNEIAPADGHLVHAEYGCGAHSEAEVEQVSPVLVADLIYDDNAMLDIELVDHPTAVADSPVEPEPPVGEHAVVELGAAELSVADPDVVAEPEVAASPVVAELGAAELSVADRDVVAESPESVAGSGVAAEPVVAVPPVVMEPPVGERVVIQPGTGPTTVAKPEAAEPPVGERAVAEPGAAKLSLAHRDEVAESPVGVEPPVGERAVMDQGAAELSLADRDVVAESPELVAGPAVVAEPEAVESPVEVESPVGERAGVGPEVAERPEAGQGVVELEGAGSPQAESPAGVVAEPEVAESPVEVEPLVGERAVVGREVAERPATGPTQAESPAGVVAEPEVAESPVEVEPLVGERAGVELGAGERPVAGPGVVEPGVAEAARVESRVAGVPGVAEGPSVVAGSEDAEAQAGGKPRGADGLGAAELSVAGLGVGAEPEVAEAPVGVESPVGERAGVEPDVAAEATQAEPAVAESLRAGPSVVAESEVAESPAGVKPLGDAGRSGAVELGVAEPVRAELPGVVAEPEVAGSPVAGPASAEADGAERVAAGPGVAEPVQVAELPGVAGSPLGGLFAEPEIAEPPVVGRALPEPDGAEGSPLLELGLVAEPKAAESPTGVERSPGGEADIAGRPGVGEPGVDEPVRAELPGVVAESEAAGSALVEPVVAERASTESPAGEGDLAASDVAGRAVVEAGVGGLSSAGSPVVAGPAGERGLAGLEDADPAVIGSGGAGAQGEVGSPIGGLEGGPVGVELPVAGAGVVGVEAPAGVGGLGLVRVRVIGARTDGVEAEG